jgi:glycosyltransferase involved in cell wall biosynthesis
VAGWAAEVNVVLNEEVTDGTEEICRQHGARVFREPWRGYVAQADSAAAKATQPWILGLDADEAVTPNCRRRSGRWSPAQRRPPGATRFRCPACLSMRDAGSGMATGIPTARSACGGVVGALGRAKNQHYDIVVRGAVGRLRGDLQHFSYRDLKHHVAKVQLYSDIYARNAFAKGRRATLWDLAVRPRLAVSARLCDPAWLPRRLAGVCHRLDVGPAGLPEIRQAEGSAERGAGSAERLIFRLGYGTRRHPMAPCTA